MSFFWQQLPKPFLALAPMEDVTDTVFRQIVLDCGRPDVMFTEFTNCEGLQSKGRDKVIHRLKYTEKERPLIAQIWGKTPEDYYNSAKQILKLGFDGIDINMGCPVKKIIKQGCCSALIENPDLALKIIQAVQKGVNDKIPVSVKTRIGFGSIKTEEWTEFLLSKGNLDCLIVHGGTAKQLSKVPNNWEEIGKVVKIRNRLQASTLIVGNGDIFSRDEAMNTAYKYGLDGIMIGRGVFTNPWIFNPDYYKDESGKIFGPKGEVNINQRLALLKKHINLWEGVWGNQKNKSLLKKYFKIYLQGFEGASQMREDWMQKLDN